MIKFKKSKLMIMVILTLTLVMFGGVNVFADTIYRQCGDKGVYMSSNAYQYYADASTNGAEYNSGVYCEILNSHYTAIHLITGTIYTEDKGPVANYNNVSVSFSAPSGYKTSSISTAHRASYMGYVRTGSTSDTYN